jgi:hypothetical protein
MQTTYYLLMNLRTSAGLENYGRFYLGNHRDNAYAIFGMLNGRADISQQNTLFVELMETKDGLPVNIQLLPCTLDELAENCRIITRELFKMYNLQESDL